MKETDIVLALDQLELYPPNELLTEDKIKAAWKKLIRVYHPDGNEIDIFTDGEKAKKVNQAKDFLIGNLDAVNLYIDGLLHPEKYKQEAASSNAGQQASGGTGASSNAGASSGAGQQTSNTQSRSAQDGGAEKTSKYTQDDFDDVFKTFNDLEETLRKAEQKARYESFEQPPENKKRKIITFALMGVSVLCVILSFIAFISGFTVEELEGQPPAFVYNIFFALPVVILTFIRTTREKFYIFVVDGVFLFLSVVYTIAAFGF